MFNDLLLLWYGEDLFWQKQQQQQQQQPPTTTTTMTARRWMDDNHFLLWYQQSKTTKKTKPVSTLPFQKLWLTSLILRWKSRLFLCHCRLGPFSLVKSVLPRAQNIYSALTNRITHTTPSSHQQRMRYTKIEKLMKIDWRKNDVGWLEPKTKQPTKKCRKHIGQGHLIMYSLGSEIVGIDLIFRFNMSHSQCRSKMEKFSMRHRPPPTKLSGFRQRATDKKKPHLAVCFDNTFHS